MANLKEYRPSCSIKKGSFGPPLSAYNLQGYSELLIFPLLELRGPTPELITVYSKGTTTVWWTADSYLWPTTKAKHTTSTSSEVYWAIFGCLQRDMGCGGQLMLLLGTPVHVPARHPSVGSGFLSKANQRGQTHNQPIK